MDGCIHSSFQSPDPESIAREREREREREDMAAGGKNGEEGEQMTLVEAALQVLNEADPVVKAQLGEIAATRWLQGQITLPYNETETHHLHHHNHDVPDRPARLPSVKLVPPSMMPKLGKGGSLGSRQAILHSLVHTESWAIDLSWDIIARFGRQQQPIPIPRDFFTDFVRVAKDEGRHFTLLSARLQQLGSYYGAFPAHDGLWDSAIRTSDSLLARLAIEHCVHEARGLDVLPSTISRFRNGGDECTANLLESVVYPEEITHCAAGVKWFSYFCLRSLGNHPNTSPLNPDTLSSHSPVNPGEDFDGGESIVCLKEEQEKVTSSRSDEQELVISTFHATVRNYFRGPLKPPFNQEAREAAGFAPEWYKPLAVKQRKTNG